MQINLKEVKILWLTVVRSILDSFCLRINTTQRFSGLTSPAHVNISVSFGCALHRTPGSSCPSLPGKALWRLHWQLPSDSLPLPLVKPDLERSLCWIIQQIYFQQGTCIQISPIAGSVCNLIYSASVWSPSLDAQQWFFCFALFVLSFDSLFFIYSNWCKIKFQSKISTCILLTAEDVQHLKNSSWPFVSLLPRTLQLVAYSIFKLASFSWCLEF